MDYADHIMKNKTPQSEKARKDQVPNTGGGYAFEIDGWKRLERFLIIGNVGGTYYATERKLTVENVDTIKELLDIDGKRVVDTIVEISDQGRAPKNTHAIFALAVCSIFGSKEVKSYANLQVPVVCRYSTDFFSWINTLKTLKNGRKSTSLKRVINRWYNQKSASALAYQVCKYPSRTVGGGRDDKGQKWSHRDLLRIARPNPDKIDSSNHAILFKYIVLGKEGFENFDVFKDNTELKYIWAHEEAKKCTTSKQIVKLIKDYKLTRESVPNNLFNNDVWMALLPTMPLTALIRNLGQMTASELLKPLSDAVSLVIDKLNDEKLLEKARIHPLNVFSALKTYSSGVGKRTNWTPVTAVSDALESAFYKSFKYVESTGKKILLGIDVSGSMTWENCSTSNILPSEAATIVAMTLARTEKNSHIMAFSDRFISVFISPKDNLRTVTKKLYDMSCGATDCSLPMIYASNKKLDVDAFIVLTDSETNHGNIHPFQALQNYRRDSKRDAKLIVCAFTANNFSIADPDDAGMMDVAGLDSAVPQIISNFIAGKI